MTNKDRPLNPVRRRLARGAVATPAVIASLTAKNALAGKFHCSVSGKASGHGSQTDDDKVCNDIGYTCGDLKWKCRNDKTLVVACLGVDYKGKTTGNRHKRARGDCVEAGFGPATCAQVLNGEDVAYPKIEKPELLLAALCAYYSAKDFGAEYHITMPEAANLYQCAVGKMSKYKKGSNPALESWECEELLMSLYRP